MIKSHIYPDSLDPGRLPKTPVARPVQSSLFINISGPWRCSERLSNDSIGVGKCPRLILSNLL
jgi:hypothetical protein